MQREKAVGSSEGKAAAAALSAVLLGQLLGEVAFGDLRCNGHHINSMLKTPGHCL